MTDKDPGKTRFKPARPASLDDKTRVAPPKPADQGKQAQQTQLSAKSRARQTDSSAGAAQPTGDAGDKTRFAPRHKAGPAGTDALVDQSGADQPSTDQARDKTRLTSKKQSAAAASAADSVAAGMHVLKKRFVLEEVLGTGGMGIVYKAKDLLMEEAKDRDPYVAIKVLSEEFKTHPEAFISLQRESRKSQRIAHPNIVNVYDFDRDDETVFMTMEYLDGEPLDELIGRYQSTGLPTDEAWNIINAMASALTAAHAERIIHSDFKPGNVFVTRKGVTKVFDFGIARAVAKVEHLEDIPQDQTLFDAGTLGALTPAYASLEMLEGEEPDVRDDIYALGCVAYEMLTGEHPYRRLPADEADKEGLKPKRIANVSKSQWRAIEKAIAFRREDRMSTVSEFSALVSAVDKPRYWLALGLMALLAVGGAGYFLYLQLENREPEFSEFDIRNEIELQLRMDFFKKDIVALINNPDFTNAWQKSLLTALDNLVVLTLGNDPWVGEQKAIIYRLYIDEIRTQMASKRFASALNLIENGKRFAVDEAELTALLETVTKQQAKQQAQNKKLAVKDRDKQKKLLAQQQKLLAQQQSAKAKEALKATEVANQQAEVSQRKQQFDIALNNVKNQLKCQGSLNMRDFETAIRKLKQINQQRYREIENEIVNTLAGCIVQIGKAFPERAEAAKKHGLRIFNSTTLAQIEIKSRDPCDESLAGLGSRGKRMTCRDKLMDKNTGPYMVVIPGSGKLSAFAIGKYEVSVAEINYYCRQTKSCQPLEQNKVLPVSNISLELARSYLKWLSQQTGRVYRLPNKTEWLHAAKTRSKSLDPNRNCELNTRGFKKGENLVKASLGRQNNWGLVNYVGNVQEWVYDTGKRLIAMGGSFKEPMESCNITTRTTHEGSADMLTGFRVLRELQG